VTSPVGRVTYSAERGEETQERRPGREPKAAFGYRNACAG
jgi:hypothetical protein